jgi:hypothetical protein
MTRITKGNRNSSQRLRTKSRAQTPPAGDCQFDSVREWFAAIDRYATADAFRGNWRKQRKCSLKSILV